MASAYIAYALVGFRVARTHAPSARAACAASRAQDASPPPLNNLAGDLLVGRRRFCPPFQKAIRVMQVWESLKPACAQRADQYIFLTQVAPRTRGGLHIHFLPFFDYGNVGLPDASRQNKVACFRLAVSANLELLSDACKRCLNPSVEARKADMFELQDRHSDPSRRAEVAFI